CGGLVLWATRFSHKCSYVGREGAARFACSGNRDTLTRNEVFLFRDAAELRTSLTIRYVNGVYSGTNYSFVWTDMAGQTRYKVSGSHQSKKGTPPAKHPFNYARTVETAWTVYLINQAQAQLQLAGAIFFNLTKGNWVRLRESGLSFQVGGQHQDWDVRDI